MILPYWEGLHADALRRAGRHEDAQAALELGFSAMQVTGEHWCESELHRIRAVLLVATKAPQDVIASTFEQAIATAQAQGAMGWVLRATLDLLEHCLGVMARPQARARFEALLGGMDPATAGPQWHQLRSLLTHVS